MEIRPLIHSPLNYIGGKFKLLKDLIPMFPNKVETFVDMFAGGLNVGINVVSEKVVANDQMTFLIDLYKYLQITDWEFLLGRIHKRIEEFSLTQENQSGYLALRDEYNRNFSPLDLFLLSCYSFNHQIRFNAKFKFNTPFGRGRSSFNKSIEANLSKFVDRLHNDNVELTSGDFLSIPTESLTDKDFVYCDPPYLITTGSYNDGKRGFKGWTEKEERELLNLLDSLNSRGIRFALSNVLVHKGLRNEILIDWAKDYVVNFISKSYSNCNYHLKDRKSATIEVLITNYVHP